MKHIRHWIAAQLFAALALGAAACLASEALPAPAISPDSTVWQPHHESFTYSGFTSSFTCDGIEGKVGQILRYFGARKDLQVSAHGCPRGPNSLSHMIWIVVDFQTLGAAPADAPSDSLVKAQWTPIQLTGQRPFFMEQGDCELIQAMRPVLTHDFQLRGLSFDTSCMPYQQSLVDFTVKGEVLKPSTEKSG